jgi:hypothetical protein
VARHRDPFDTSVLGELDSQQACRALVGEHGSRNTDEGARRRRRRHGARG